MGKRIYVGNLPWATASEDLRELFEQHGEVVDAVVMKDRATGRSRGFGFVEMASDEAGDAAIAAINGSEIDGRELVVNEAQERRARGGSRRD